MTARFLTPLFLALTLLPVTTAPALAQRSGEMVLLLGVQRAGKVDPKLTRSLRDALTKAGETLAKDNALVGPERLCNNEACFSQLASREGAASVLSAQIQDTPSGPFLTMSVYDADRQVTGVERMVCDKCTPPQTLSAIVDLGTRILRDAREKRSTAATETPSSPTSGTSPMSGSTPTSGTTPPGEATSLPGTTPPPATAQPLETPAQPATGDFFSRWPTKRKVAAGVLAGLLVATLIPTIALFATDGQDTTLVGCSGNSGFCKLQNKPLWAAGFGLSGALAIGIGITFAWPLPKNNSIQPVQSSSLPAEAK